MDKQYRMFSLIGQHSLKNCILKHKIPLKQIDFQYKFFNIYGLMNLQQQELYSQINKIQLHYQHKFLTGNLFHMYELSFFQNILVCMKKDIFEIQVTHIDHSSKTIYIIVLQNSDLHIVQLCMTQRIHYLIYINLDQKDIKIHI